MKNIKKIIAGVSAISMVAMSAVYFSADAAGITATTTWTDLTHFTINSASLDGGNEVSNVVIREMNGTSFVAGATTFDATDLDGLTTVTVTNNLDAAKTYLVSFNTASGDNGVTTLVGSSSTQNKVTVSATVLPTLALTVNNTAINFGPLNVGSTTNSSSSTAISVTTNAGTYAVKAAIVGKNSTADVLEIAGATTAAERVGLSLSNNEATPKTGIVSGGTILDNTDNGATNVTYVAADAAGKTAGSYSATVTYTATGNF